MKKFFIILLVLMLCFVLATLNNNRPRVIISRLLDKQIQKDQPRYIVNLLGILPVGEAEFLSETIEDYGGIEGRKVYHLSAKAQNLKVYSKLFQGTANLDSYLDVRSLSPFLFKQSLSVSGKKDVIKEVTYDQQNHIMSIAEEKREILPNTQDPLSAVFKIRKMDFEKVKVFEMNINTNQKNYTLRGNAVLKDLLIRNQKHQIVIIDANISRREKSPYHKTSIRMVLWKDRQNLPIYVKVFASGFLINARLSDIE